MAYTDHIRDALVTAGYPGHTDPATLELIEDCLRVNLGLITRDDFTVEVSLIIEDLISHPQETGHLCRLLGFALPGWLDGPHTPATVMPWSATSQQITDALHAAFPGTTFILTTARGMGRGHALLRWTGGPTRADINQVTARFLPDQAQPDGPRYGLIAIYTCRIAALEELVGS